MRMPNFLVIGAAKAGTTALYDYLGAHPDIYMSPLKETNFLALEGHPLDFSGPGDSDYINKWSITTLDEYCAQFRGVTTERAVGEACPLYLYDPEHVVIERIKKYVPDAKLIAMLRNPVDRAYSAFLHLYRDGREPLTEFGPALDMEAERVAAGWEHIWHYKQMGFYGRQLERYYSAFGRERMLVFLYNDLLTDAVGVMQTCYRFLGVDDAFVPDMTIRPNSALELGDRKPPILPEVREQLARLYDEDISLLERLICRDLSHWRMEPPRMENLPPVEVGETISATG